MACGVAEGGRLKKPKLPNSAIIRRFDDPFYAMSPRPLILTVLLAALPLSAAPETPDGGDLNSIRHAIDEAQSELQQKQQAQRQAQQTLAKTRAALEKAQRELAGITRRQQDSRQKLQTLQNELEGLKTEIAGRKAQVARLLNGHYKNRQNNAVILFLKNAEPGRKSRYLEYARRIGSANRNVVSELVVQQQELHRREQEIDAELAKLAKLKAEKEAALSRLGKHNSAAQRENSRLNAEIDKQNQNLNKLRADESKLNQILADIARRNAAKRKQEAAARTKAARERLAAEKAKNRPAKPDNAEDKAASAPAKPPVSTLTEEDRALQGEYAAQANNTFSRLQGRLPHPVGGSITGRFGKPRPDGGVWRGLFFATAPSPVRSVADGTVAYAGALNGYGNTVVIDYGGGYTGVYTGLSSIAVGSGGSVKTGGTIGTSGSLPSGEQGLYFEIRYRLAAMNPAAWLR